jgi:hypothetical protein
VFAPRRQESEIELRELSSVQKHHLTKRCHLTLAAGTLQRRLKLPPGSHTLLQHGDVSCVVRVSIAADVGSDDHPRASLCRAAALSLGLAPVRLCG